MKKLTTLLLAFLFSVAVFAQIKVPKNTNPSSEDLKLRYTDDKLEFNYEVLAIASNKSTPTYCVKFKKKSLVSNVEAIVQLNFKNENGLDFFLETLNNYYYSPSDIPNIFDECKEVSVDNEIEPIYTSDKNGKLKTILYVCPMEDY